MTPHAASYPVAISSGLRLVHRRHRSNLPVAVLGRHAGADAGTGIERFLLPRFGHSVRKGHGVCLQLLGTGAGEGGKQTVFTGHLRRSGRVKSGSGVRSCSA